MFGGEIVVILAVAFLLFGPEKMPEIGKSVGKALRELHKVRQEFMDGLSASMDDDEEQHKRRP